MKTISLWFSESFQNVPLSASLWITIETPVCEWFYGIIWPIFLFFFYYHLLWSKWFFVERWTFMEWVHSSGVDLFSPQNHILKLMKEGKKDSRKEIQQLSSGASKTAENVYCNCVTACHKSIIERKWLNGTSPQNEYLKDICRSYLQKCMYLQILLPGTSINNNETVIRFWSRFQSVVWKQIILLTNS